MKVAMMLIHDPADYTGAAAIMRGHIRLFEDLFGKENVQIYILSKHPDQVSAKSANWHGYLEMNNFQRFFAALKFQKSMSSRTEEEIVQGIHTFAPDLLWVGTSVLGKFVARDWKIPTFTFLINIEKNYSWNQVKHRGPHYLPSYWASCYNEKLAVKKSSFCVCLNKRDGNLLYDLYGRHPDLYLPVSFDDRYDETIAKSVHTDENELLFIGTNFAPNAHGIRWFIKNVMPSLTSCHLTIVGNSFELLRDELEGERIQVVGTVDDLAPYYYRAAAMVMPILFGDGMKVKTADAMMYGKMIFASQEALEGYEAENVPGICRCDSAQDYIDKISEFFNDPDRKTYWPEVRQHFLENYEIDKQKTALAELISKITK